MAWGLVITAVVSAGVGLYSANKADKANQSATNLSREDYESRIKAAQEGFAMMQEHYNAAKAERPNLTWEGYSAELVKALNDPKVTAAYAKSKASDFATLSQLAKSATEMNLDNFSKTFDDLNGGKGREILTARQDLALNDDTAARVTRAYELRAPQIGAGTVRYDEKGKLIEGQRADKQVFTTAYETVVDTNRERLANLTALERDRSQTALSQQERAKDFMSFYDSTGFKATAFQEQRNQQLDFQKMDEMQAFQLMSTFASAASGITPVQPQLQDTSRYSAMIGQAATSFASAYANNASKNNTANSGGETTQYGSGSTQYQGQTGTGYYLPSQDSVYG